MLFFTESEKCCLSLCLPLLFNFLIASAIHDITTSNTIIIAIPKLASSPWFVVVAGSDVGLGELGDDILSD
jgi:hypothetical protein